VTQPAVEPVDVLGVHEVGAPQGFRQGFLAFGRHDEVDVVRHEAVGRDRQTVALGTIPEVGQINAPVIVGEENVLLVIAPLGHVMGDPRDYNSRLPSHGKTIPQGAEDSNKWLLSPFIGEVFLSVKLPNLVVATP
jgi:hypothetical protein